MKSLSQTCRKRIELQGQVQGVGFRPWIYRHAMDLGLTGFVRNTPQALQIEIQGATEAVEAFLRQLDSEPPVQATIASARAETIACREEAEFVIQPSDLTGEHVISIPPDLATCSDCQNDFLSTGNRRFRYAFTNCTNCGPRYTIIEQMPYDRARTTMAEFTLCPECQREYTDPGNRRFEAQPNACPVCGPKLTLLTANQEPMTGDPIEETVKQLRAGKVVAIKGLGGYHLACDATNAESILRLRERKHRPDKALAVMFSRIEQIEKECLVDRHEARMLSSHAAPIVICRRRPDSRLPRQLSPDTNDVGVFLSYTPLHHLILREISPLVMTSGNLSEEPMIKDEEQLGKLLGGIADFALVHNRKIARQCDDSVMKVVDGKQLFYRRARGFVPNRIATGKKAPVVLAAGADLKNTFCIAHHGWAYPSQHVGDLADYASQEYYWQQLENLLALHKVVPDVVTHDMHPDYHSTRLARRIKANRHMEVQHHHAHIAACMLENQLEDKVIGVALDGTGYGPDGTVWGGEVLVADYTGFDRMAFFRQYAMPGGEQAIIHPDRMAFSCLYQDVTRDPDQLATLLPGLTPQEIAFFTDLLEKKKLAPLTSSAGRLFDAVAALLGLASPVTYEGQAAVQLQSLVDPTVTESYTFALEQTPHGQAVSFQPMFSGLAQDCKRLPKSTVATKFHRTLVEALAAVVAEVRARTSLTRIVLSGGVFQNDFLLAEVKKRLSRQGFAVYSHHTVPPNDGGISLGQAAIALATYSV